MNDVRHPIKTRFFSADERDALLQEINAQYSRNSDAVIMETENAEGNHYFLISENIQALHEDWLGNCEYVPENDAPVFMLMIGGQRQLHVDTFEKTLQMLLSL